MDFDDVGIAMQVIEKIQQHPCISTARLVSKGEKEKKKKEDKFWLAIFYDDTNKLLQPLLERRFVCLSRRNYAGDKSQIGTKKKKVINSLLTKMWKGVIGCCCEFERRNEANWHKHCRN